MDILNKLTALEKNASAFGFKWENPQQILAQVRSEISEIEIHLQDHDANKLQEEIGDLLHAVFSLCVFCQFDPQDTLTNSINKFKQRFNKVQELAYSQGLSTLNGKSFEELMLIWDSAKKACLSADLHDSND